MLRGHTSNVFFIAHQSDSRMMSASEDGTVRYWSTAGVSKQTIRGAPLPVCPPDSILLALSLCVLLALSLLLPSSCLSCLLCLFVSCLLRLFSYLLLVFLFFSLTFSCLSLSFFLSVFCVCLLSLHEVSFQLTQPPDTTS